MGVTSSIELSVIVLSYNNADYIIECLDSIRAQGVTSYEVIIIDDCSTDDSVQRVRAYIADKPEFSLVEKKENSGGAVSSQIGISKAVGKYLALVDSDDIVANGAYGLLISRIEKDGSDFAAGLPIKLNSSCRLVIPEIELPIYSSNRVLESDEEIIEFALQPFYWNIVFKTSFIKNHNIYMPSDLLIADRVFVYRAIVNAKKISIACSPAYYWRQKNNSKKKSITDRKSDYSMIVDRCDSFRAQMRITFEEAERGNIQFNRRIWELSLHRVFIPLYTLFDKTHNQPSWEEFETICEHYQMSLREFAAFFLRLIADSEVLLKDKYIMYLLMIGEFEQLNSFLQGKSDYFAIRPHHLIDSMVNEILAEYKAVFVSDVVNRNGRWGIALKYGKEYQRTCALKVRRAIAHTRYFTLQRIELPYDENAGVIDISALKESEYVLYVEYDIFGKKRLERLSALKEFAPVIDRYNNDYVIQYHSKHGFLRIWKKNRFSMVFDKEHCYLHINDCCIKNLFYFNLEGNERDYRPVDDNNMVDISREPLRQGTNLLFYETVDGSINVVSKEECSSSSDYQAVLSGYFLNDRIEIVV